MKLYFGCSEMKSVCKNTQNKTNRLRFICKNESQFCFYRKFYVVVLNVLTKTDLFIIQYAAHRVLNLSEQQDGFLGNRCRSAKSKRYIFAVFLIQFGQLSINF